MHLYGKKLRIIITQIWQSTIQRLCDMVNFSIHSKTEAFCDLINGVRQMPTHTKLWQHTHVFSSEKQSCLIGINFYIQIENGEVVTTISIISMIGTVQLVLQIGRPSSQAHCLECQYNTTNTQ